MPIASMIRSGAEMLREAGVPAAQHDAKLLLAHVLGCELRDVDKAIVLGSDLSDMAVGCSAAELVDRYRALLVRRTRREPLQHIVGHAPFRYLDLRVGPGVFIPRPETEDVVQAGMDWLARRHLERPLIADLCAGSGAIGLSMVTELSDARVWAVERSRDAYRWADRNRRAVSRQCPRVLRDYHLVLGDATDPRTLRDADGMMDMVITNPPYIPLSEIPQQPEVRDYDPSAALYGGSDDGLLIPERILVRARGLLRAGGVLIMEHDISQREALVEYARRQGFGGVRDCADLSGRPRFMIAIRG
ncbi:MAG: peptide chain release factor N(5)-glutamine methyltransferase [Bifidobacterium sp.]|nr:peptide chain release factor N(5)-glutamine methyltransferase [Bifidobacterium sp.]MCI1865146.1 peptide chain release factor N(5)-glutamine methyltransferase [Bifidobacterium sp.]